MWLVAIVLDFTAIFHQMWCIIPHFQLLKLINVYPLCLGHPLLFYSASSYIFFFITSLWNSSETLQNGLDAHVIHSPLTQ